jgi:hypothetical protein
VPYKPTATKGIISQGMFLANMAKDHIAVSLNSEQTWKDFLNTKKPDERFRYVRLNTTFTIPPPALDDLTKLKELREMANKQFAGQYETKLLALKLVASSFYFQPDEADPLKRKEVTGRSIDLLVIHQLTLPLQVTFAAGYRMRMQGFLPWASSSSKRLVSQEKHVFSSANKGNPARTLPLSSTLRSLSE